MLRLEQDSKPRLFGQKATNHHSFIHCRHLYSASSSGATQKGSQPQRGRIMLFQVAPHSSTSYAAVRVWFRWMHVSGVIVFTFRWSEVDCGGSVACLGS